MPNRKDLCVDIRRMDETLDRTPRVIDILHASKYNRADYRAVFTSWQEAIRAAVGPRTVEPFRGELLARIIELHVTVEPDPSIQTWNEETLYLPHVFYEGDQFESWTDAKRRAGITITHGGILEGLD